MKIEKITITNINSLSGTFTIDLMEKSINQSGIFCITGPTGSGKSTILDAICFALYRKTPRVEGISDTVNELMSKGAKSCRAEVVFSQNGKRYKVFSTHRCKKPGSNTPFANPEQELYIQTPDGNWELLNNQFRSVQKEISAITGLTMENFTRSVVLPQGQFSAFLKAQGSERAEILSTITHTEVYERIGNYVHLQVAALKDKKASFPDISTMSVEARVAKERELKDIITAAKKAGDTIVALNNALQWIADCEQAENKVKAAENSLQDAQQYLKTLKDNGAEKQIAQAKSAKEVQPTAVNLRSAQTMLEHCRNKRQPAESAYTEAAGKAEQAAAHATKLCQVAKREQAELLAKLREVNEFMRKDESSLTTQGKMVLMRQQDAEKSQKAAQEATKTATIAANEAKTAQCILEEATKCLAQKQADAALEENLPKVETILNLWQAEPNGSAPLPPTAELQAEHTRVVKEIADILQGRTQQELVRYCLNLENLAARAEEFDSAAKLQKEAEADFESAKATHAGLPDCDAAEQKLHALNEKVEMLGKIQSIDDKLKSLYNDFAAGKLECCPCCGSTTPTKSPHSLYDTELQQTQVQRKHAQQELANIRKQHQDAERKLSATKATLEGRQKTQHEADKKRNEALSLCGFDSVPEAMAATIMYTRQQLTKLEALQEYASELQGKRKPAELRDKLQQALLSCTTQQAQTLQEAVALVRKLRKNLQEYRELTQHIKAAEQNLNSLRARAESTAKTKDEALTRSKVTTQEWNNLHADFEQKKTAFNNKWGAGNTADTLATRYQTRIDRLTADMNEATTAATTANHNTKMAELALNTVKTRISEAELQKNNAERAMQSALSEHGFSSEEDFRLASQFIPTAATLEAQLNELKTAIETRTALLERERKAYSDLQKQKPEYADSPVLELNEQRQQQVEQLEQYKKQEIALAVDLENDDRNIQLKKQNAQELEAIEAELGTWSKLKDVLGGTNGSFKLIAQQYTFDMLIKKANIELAKLSPRFKLKRTTGEKAKDGLGLNVIDYELNSGVERSCNNLSGGETFIVSMALALGLSKLASNTQIDTLFLDEGFGTLDSATLNQVLNSLGSMCGEGKTIGIISHVEQISEQVPCRLELKPLCGGFSTIVGSSAVKSEPKFPSEQK